MCSEGWLRDKRPSLLGGQAVNITVVLEVNDALCGEGMCICVCVCAGKRISDGTGRRDQCEAHQEERLHFLWSHLLGSYRQAAFLFSFSIRLMALLFLGCFIYESINHEQKLVLSFSQFASLLYPSFLLPLHCALSSIFFSWRKNIPPFFLPQWFVSVLYCL